MLKCGFYEKEITPAIGTTMVGYNGFRITTSVHDKLFVKAMAVDVDGSQVIMVVFDLLATSDKLCQGVLSRITEFTGVSADRIMVSATHTHYGPTLPGAKGEYDMPDVAYEDVLIKAGADAGILAWQNMEPGTIKYASSIEEGLGFNRDFKMKDGSVRTNPTWQNPDIIDFCGPTDPQFQTLYFENQDGALVGAFLNFTCHHDAIGLEYNAWINSADFSGRIARNLKKHYGMDFVSVYVDGCSGNINHFNPFREKEEYDEPRSHVIGEQLAKAAILNYENAQVLKTDVVSVIKEDFYVGKQHFTDEEVADAYHLYKTVSLDEISVNINKPESVDFRRAKAKPVINITEMPEEIRCCIQTIRIGDFALYCLNGEIYVEFGLDIKKKSPSKYTAIATHCSGYPQTYVPVRELRGTNVYAAQKTAAYLEDEAGYKFVEKAIEQGNKLFK